MCYTIKNEYVGEAINFIEEHYDEELTVEEISDYLCLNRSYFGKIFRNATGVSPQNYLISHRMSKATELLVETDLCIKEISESVGYTNQLHFSRAFKKVFGLSPSYWRQQHSA